MRGSVSGHVKGLWNGVVDETPWRLLRQCANRKFVVEIEGGARTWGEVFDPQQAIHEAMDWLHFYNEKRLHSTLDYVSSMQFEAAWHADQLKQTA